MTTKTALEPSPLDTVKLVVALAILAGSVFAFHYFADASRLLRVVGVIAAIGVALLIALQTGKGRQASGFFREAQIEVRKVVWPTRQETVQTTLVVMIVVVVFALLLWVLDLMLGAGIQTVIGRGA